MPILNTEHYIFYWIANDEIKDFIEEYPEDYEEYITLKVDDMCGGNAIGHLTVKIEFNRDHPHNVERIHRFCDLANFRDVVKEKYAQFNGSIAALKLKEKESELAYHKREVERYEKEIKELQEQIK